MDEGLILLLVGVVLAASVVVALGAARTGAPRPRRVSRLWGCSSAPTAPAASSFDDAELPATSGSSVSSSSSSKAGCRRRGGDCESVVVPAALLSTVGVFVTALLTGLAAQLLFDLSWLESFLLGRRRRLDRRSRRLRDASLHEDPPPPGAHARGRVRRQRPDGDRAHARADRLDRADPDSYGFGDLVLLVVRQLGLGLAVGVVLGAAATWIFARLPRVGRPVRTGRVARGRGVSFGAADVRRRQRLPLRLPRRARRRQHAVALPAPARRASTKGSPSSRRLSSSSSSACSSSRTTCRTSRSPASRSPHCSAGDPAGGRLGLDRLQRLHGRASGSCSGGPVSAARSRSCSRPSCSRRTSPARTRSSTRSSSSSSSPRSCRARRSSGSPAGSTCSPRSRRGTSRPSRSAGPARRPPRLRRRRGSRDRGRGRSRGRPAAHRDHRRRRPGRRSSRRAAAPSSSPATGSTSSAPHGMRPAIEDVFSRWQRRV